MNTHIIMSKLFLLKPHLITGIEPEDADGFGGSIDAAERAGLPF